MTVRGHGTGRRDSVEAHGSSQDRGNSGLRVESAPATAGSSVPQPKPSLQDLARLFLSLSGSREQWDAIAGCYRFRCCVVAWSRCSSASSSPLHVFVCECACSGWGGLLLVLLPQLVRPVGGSALGSPPALNGATGACLAGRGPSQGRSVPGRSPSPVRSSRLAHSSA